MKVKELLTSEDKWCTNTLARDRNRRPVSPVADTACSWCLIGAIHKCYRYEPEKRQELYNKIQHWLIIPKSLRNEEEGTCIGIWNDRLATFVDIQNVVNELDF